MHHCYRQDEIEPEETDEIAIMNQIARKRNCYMKGQELDIMKASALFIEEFRSGKLGRITLEFPE